MTGVPIRPNPAIDISIQERRRFGTGEEARDGDRPLALTKIGTVGRGISLFDPTGKYELAAKEKLYNDALSGNSNNALNYNQQTGEYDIPWWQRLFSGIDDQDVADAKFKAAQTQFRRKNPGIDDRIDDLNKQSKLDPSKQIRLGMLNLDDVLGQVQNEEDRQKTRRDVRSLATQSGLDILPETFESQSKSEIEGLNRRLTKGVKYQNKAEGLALDLDKDITDAIKSGVGFSGIQAKLTQASDRKSDADTRREFKLLEENPEFQLKQSESTSRNALAQANIDNLTYNQDRQSKQDAFNNNRLLRQDAIANKISLGDLDLQTTKLGLEAQQAQNNYNLQMRQYEADVDYRNRRMEYDRARLGQERMDNIFKLLLGGTNLF